MTITHSKPQCAVTMTITMETIINNTDKKMTITIKNNDNNKNNNNINNNDNNNDNNNKLQQ